MARKVILKKRINIEAWKMKKFYANELLTVLNNYPNMDGRGRTKYQMTIWRLTNLLKGNPNIEYIKMDRFHKKPGMWKWIGEEE